MAIKNSAWQQYNENAIFSVNCPSEVLDVFIIVINYTSKEERMTLKYIS